MIALFAARAPRVRSMASLRLGVSVIRSGDMWRLIFESDDVKTKRRIAYDAPASLSGAIERYITVEREELLAGETHDWFWVNHYGGPLTVCAIQAMIVLGPAVTSAPPSVRTGFGTRWARPRR